MGVSLTRARAAKPAVLRIFRKLGEVAGVGITRMGDDYAVKVNLRVALGADVEAPATVNGVPVYVEVTGPIAPY